MRTTEFAELGVRMDKAASLKKRKLQLENSYSQIDGDIVIKINAIQIANSVPFKVDSDALDRLRETIGLILAGLIKDTQQEYEEV